jgi:hypothetical protein
MVPAAAAAISDFSYFAFVSARDPGDAIASRSVFAMFYPVNVSVLLYKTGLPGVRGSHMRFPGSVPDPRILFLFSADASTKPATANAAISLDAR